MCPNKLNDLKFLQIQNDCGIYVLSGITEMTPFEVLKKKIKHFLFPENDFCFSLLVNS